MKRKADDQPSSGESKIQRKDAPAQAGRMNGFTRPDQSKPKPSTPVNSMPYRGTANLSGLAAAKGQNPSASKPSSRTSTPMATSKPSVSASKPPVAKAVTGAASSAPKKKGTYAEMMAKAKQQQETKPAAAPPVKHEPMKILTKKERIALREEEKAKAKGKKPSTSTLAKIRDNKEDLGKERRKPADVGYQGTARTVKKPADTGYKGTARPTAGLTGKPSPSDRSRSTSLTAKGKPKPQARWGGYASWSDEDEMLEEEDDYESDMSEDMEGGMWDLEQEEALALKAAKKEDAEALREEEEHKRAKEERKRKLMAMSKAAAAKRKY